MPAIDTLTVSPLDRTLTFGAVIEGVDLKILTAQEWEKLHNTFLEHGMLVIKDQNFATPDEQMEFAKRWGEFELPFLNITNKTKNGSTAKEGSNHFKNLKGNEGWHTDSTYMRISSKCGILYAPSAKDLPKRGGETAFADMRYAFESLDEKTKERVKNLAAFHSIEYSQAKMGHLSYTDGGGYGSHGNAYLRPLVKIHPDTNRPSLMVGRHAFGIPAMRKEESDELIRSLNSFSVQTNNIYTHNWSGGDLVIWDNRCMLHRACEYDPNEVRVLWGNRIAGEQKSEVALPAPDNREVLADALQKINDEFAAQQQTARL